MRDLTSKLQYRIILYEKLLPYGFIKKNEKFYYTRKILDNRFEIRVWIQNGNMFSLVYDIENECEYALVNVVTATGEFVGRVKEEYENCIQNIIEQCTSVSVFQFPQSKEMIDYIENKYQDELEFLWENSLSAIWRNKTNRKWYGLMFIISKRKLGIDSDEMIEALNLRCSKDEGSSLVDYKKVFPGYHMNKKSWITIPLDKTVDSATLYSWIDLSYQLSLKK